MIEIIAPAHRRDRKDVAVADRRERHDRPSHCRGDVGELVRLSFVFGEVHERRRHYDHRHHHHHRYYKFFLLVPEHAHEQPQGRRISAELRLRETSQSDLYERHTKMWMKRYGTGSGSDRVVLWDARSTPRPVATAPGTDSASLSVYAIAN